MKYFLYARKSTDVEDKQVLSIEAQLVELHSLAKRDKLEIVEEFIEKRSAKTPGRPIFEEMLSRIERGDARGVVCWKIDRLSRNPVDSGRISWLLQRGVIQQIQTHDRTYLPQDNVLIMSVEFGMANEYIRQLSVNAARGLRQKARNGHYPSIAPIGYLNDLRTKTIVADRKKSKIVRAAFELYAQNGSRLEDISRFLFEHGVHTRPTKRWSDSGSRPLKKDQAKLILTNSFYYGHFRYAGEMYEGKHTPIIAKELFDKVQKSFGVAWQGAKVKEKSAGTLRSAQMRGVRLLHHGRSADEEKRPLVYILSLHKETRRVFATIRPRGNARYATLRVAIEIPLAARVGGGIRSYGYERRG